jgi:mono/diheme cytochrome c family protein
MKRLIYLAITSVLLFFYAKCTERGDFAGKEYMPDMAHPVSYEAQLNNNFYWNHFGTEEDYRYYAQARKPATGTIARGKHLYHFSKSDTTAAYAQKNPVVLTKAGFERAEQLYGVYCGVCHGKTAEGNGQLYGDGSGPYGQMPQNLTKPEYIAAGDGRIYHTIMYGIRSMGAYKDKLNEEERWLVVHYIRYLQAQKGAKPSVDAFIANPNAR